MNYAIILASGSGTRFGATMLKQMVRIAGKRLYEHTLTAFQSHDRVDQILLVGNDAIMERAAQIKAVFPKIAAIIPGGDTRTSSTVGALDYLRSVAGSGDKVLIHDAVRPFVSAYVISSMLDALDQFDAADTVIDSTDTMVVVQDGVVQAIPDRSKLKRGQTPQGFRFGKLDAAFARYLASDRSIPVTDDCAVYLNFRGDGDTDVAAVPGAKENIKITFSNDLLLAEEIFRLGFMQSVQAEKPLVDKVAVVFGGNSGIGKKLSERLTAQGVHVSICSRASGCDIRHPAQIEAALVDIRKRYGRIDHVICTSGVLLTGDVDGTAIDRITETIDTNFLGSVNVAQAAFPYLRETRGQLVLFSSSSYTRGRGGSAVYAATKAAIANFTQGLADEWADAGVKVNCIAPARTDTGLRSAHFASSDEPADLLDPCFVAEMVEKTLMSEMSGQILHISKGRDRPTL